MVLEDMRAIRGQDEFGAAASWPAMPTPEPEPEPQPSKRDQMLARQKSRRQQRLIAMPPEAKRIELFDLLDSDGADVGKLTMHEYSAGLPRVWPELGEQRSVPERAFAACDADGSGLVTRDRFRLLLHYTLWFHEKANLLHLIEREADEGQLTVEQFVAGARKLGNGADDEALRIEFAALDRFSRVYHKVGFAAFCTWAARTQAMLHGWDRLGSDEPEPALEPESIQDSRLSDAERRLREMERKLQQVETEHQTEIDKLKDAHDAAEAERRKAERIAQRGGGSQPPAAPTETFVQELFGTVDRDGSGYISRAELTQAIQADSRVREALGIAHSLGAQDLEKTLDGIKQLRGRSAGRISLATFESWVQLKSFGQELEPEPEPEARPFIPSKKFDPEIAEGLPHGYEFKLGVQGIGFYRTPDALPAAEALGFAVDPFADSKLTPDQRAYCDRRREIDYSWIDPRTGRYELVEEEAEKEEMARTVAMHDAAQGVGLWWMRRCAKHGVEGCQECMAAFRASTDRPLDSLTLA